MAELQALVRMFDDAEDATYDARERAERDRDYFDGKQLTTKEIAELNKRGQPPLKFNRIRGKVDWYKGLEAQRRTDPKAYPEGGNLYRGSGAGC